MCAGRVPQQPPTTVSYTHLDVYKRQAFSQWLAFGVDLNHGGGFLIPSIDLALGDKWRAKAEADIFWTSGSGKTLFDPNPGVQLFGYFANNSQLTFRLTRQF